MFAEITLIRGDYVGRIYFEHLLDQADLDQADLDSAELRAWLELAGRQLGSGYELAELLIRVAERYPSGLSLPESYHRAASTIGSDYELAELLVEVRRSQPLEGAAREAFVAALDTVGSRYEHRRAAEVLTRPGG